jgi:nucleoside-diphosphate-sugar epimerase
VHEIDSPISLRNAFVVVNDGRSMKTFLVTGSSGLIGSEVVDYFCRRGWDVHGIDNNMRADFFGPEGDTRWNQKRLLAARPRFRHHELDDAQAKYADRGRER